MKYLLYILPLLFWMCTPSENISTFSVGVTPSATSVTIDEPFTITITSNETMNWMAITTDGSDPVNFSGSNFGTSKVLYFTFDTLGNKIIKIKAKSQNNDVVLKAITIAVTRGNAIKITGLQVKSFYNINNTWDPEYAVTDINRLADVSFVLMKIQQTNALFSDYSYNNNWYRSTVKENQGDLTWDLLSANLYINPNASLKFALGDRDGALAQDLLMGPPDTKTINFSSYIATKPNTITQMARI